MNRRDFIKTSTVFVFAATFGGALKNVLAGALPAGKKDCSTSNDPVANALGYVGDAKKIDTKKYPQFKKPQKDHDCKGCALFTATSGGWGNCTMITGCVVAEKGLCGSWQKKVKKS